MISSTVRAPAALLVIGLSSPLVACRARAVEAPPDGAPASREASAPQIWLEPESFDEARSADEAPASEVQAPLAGFTGEPLATSLDADGLQRSDYALGEGPAAQPGSTIVFDYVGTLTDGTEFDSTHARATPFRYQLGQEMLIPGLERGLLGGRPGMRRKLVIPPELGYGAVEHASIPPHSTLIFYVEVRSVEPP